MKSGREKLSKTQPRAESNTYWAITKPRIWSSCTWPNTPLGGSAVPGRPQRKQRALGSSEGALGQQEGNPPEAPFHRSEGRRLWWKSTHSSIDQEIELLYWTALLLLLRCLVSNSWWPHGLQHARLPCPSLSPRVCSYPCPLSRWGHPTISSCRPLSSCPQSFPASDRIFSNKSALWIVWTNYQSFSFKQKHGNWQMEGQIWPDWEDP